MAINLAEAIIRLHPQADPVNDFQVHDTGSGQFIGVWNLPYAKPTEAELQKAYDDLVAERQATAYIALRAAEYPPIGDQLDALWKIITPPSGSDAAAVKAKIEAVKGKYPKPSAS